MLRNIDVTSRVNEKEADLTKIYTGVKTLAVYVDTKTDAGENVTLALCEFFYHGLPLEEVAERLRFLASAVDAAAATENLDADS